MHYASPTANVQYKRYCIFKYKTRIKKYHEIKEILLSQSTAMHGNSYTLLTHPSSPRLRSRSDRDGLRPPDQGPVPRQRAGDGGTGPSQTTPSRKGHHGYCYHTDPQSLDWKIRCQFCAFRVFWQDGTRFGFTPGNPLSKARLGVDGTAPGHPPVRVSAAMHR